MKLTQNVFKFRAAKKIVQLTWNSSVSFRTVFFTYMSGIFPCAFCQFLHAFSGFLFARKKNNEKTRSKRAREYNDLRASERCAIHRRNLVKGKRENIVERKVLSREGKTNRDNIILRVCVLKRNSERCVVIACHSPREVVADQLSCLNHRYHWPWIGQIGNDNWISIGLI